MKYFIPLIIGLEILVGVLSTTVPKGQYYPNAGQKRPNILGESDLAQNPEDTATPIPEDQPQDTPTEIVQPTSQEPTVQQISPTPQVRPNILGESDLAQNPEDTATPIPEEQPTDQPQDTPTEIVQPTSEDTVQPTSQEPTSQEPTVQQISPTPQVSESQTTNGVITVDTQNKQNPPPEELKTNLQFLDTMVFTGFTPDNSAQTLDPKTVADVKSENQQLAAVESPQAQANLLVQFEAKDIQTINSNFKTNQFDDMAFNTGRLNSQIDKTIETIQNLPPNQAQAIRSKVSNICKSAEYLLRPGELVVSEDLEQTIQISRGKCFNFQQ